MSIVSNYFSLISNYLNVYKFKFKCFVEYREDDDEEYEEFRLDNFFEKPPVIPTPPLRISVDFPNFYDYDLILDAIKNLKLHGPSRYSLYFPIFRIDDEFFIQLLKHYQNANPEELPKTVKFGMPVIMFSKSSETFSKFSERPNDM